MHSARPWSVNNSSAVSLPSRLLAECFKFQVPLIPLSPTLIKVIRQQQIPPPRPLILRTQLLPLEILPLQLLLQLWTRSKTKIILVSDVLSLASVSMIKAVLIKVYKLLVSTAKRLLQARAVLQKGYGFRTTAISLTLETRR